MFEVGGPNLKVECRKTNLGVERRRNPWWSEKGRRRKTYRDVRITRASLGISSREDSVNKNKSSNNLSTKSCSPTVTRINGVGSAAVVVIIMLHKSLNQPNADDGSGALRHHVPHRSNQWHFPREKQPECHRRINMTTYKKTETLEIRKSKIN